MNELVARSMALFASKIAEVNEYGWDDKFKNEYIRESLDYLCADIRGAVSVTGLSKNELQELGFIPFTVRKLQKEVMLIPLYILPVIPKGTIVVCIDGRECVIGNDRIDNDVRCGCIAYGVEIDNEVNHNTRIIPGKDIWYVDKKSNIIEHGTVFSANYKERLERISVDFEGGDFDEFCGEAVGKCLFLSKEVAENKLMNT